jgi:hypothetical protein
MMNNKDKPITDEIAENITEQAVQAAQEILTGDGKDLRSHLNKNIVMNALSCQNLDILDLKMIDRVIAEFQHAAHVFKPYRSDGREKNHGNHGRRGWYHARRYRRGEAGKQFRR